MNISNQSWWYLILKAKPTIRGRMTFKMKIWSFLFLRSLSVTGRQGSLLTTRRPTIIVRCSALCIALLPRAIDCFDALPSFILQHNSMPVGKGKVNSRMCQVCLKSLFRPSLFVKRLPRLTSFREQCWWWWWRWWQWWWWLLNLGAKLKSHSILSQQRSDHDCDVDVHPIHLEEYNHCLQRVLEFSHKNIQSSPIWQLIVAGNWQHWAELHPVDSSLCHPAPDVTQGLVLALYCCRLSDGCCEKWKHEERLARPASLPHTNIHTTH